jgi:hypothetical protein
MLRAVTRIPLEAASDLIQRLAYETQPLKAVIELIWNGLDADAHRVTVTIARTGLDGVGGVVVEDDGHGMSPEACDSAFRRVGGSWKLLARISQGEGRPLHGQSGQGRLRAFALGSTVRWTTVADDTTGKRVSTVVSASDADRSAFDMSSAIPTSEDTGTQFEASGKQSAHLTRLLAETAQGTIAAALAPYLIAHPDVEVVYDGQTIRPQDNIDQEQTYDLTFQHDGIDHAARLRIIEWASGGERSLHLCDGDGIPIDDVPATTAPDFAYSAYVLWPSMPEHRNEWLLGESEQTVIGSLLTAAKAQLEDHFESRRAEQRRRLVADWKDKNTYPYKGEATSESDTIERATFDVVATSIRRHIPRDVRKQRLTLGLLKNSLQHRPGDMSRVLNDFLGLPKDEREQLERLLDRTSLSRVIQASTSVTDRLDFIAALEHLTFDPEASRLTRERDHLHQLMERELWVFGEEYNMMISERSLTAVLDRHLELLGRTRDDTQSVKRLDGTTGRVDLMLSAAATEHDRNRHLVIELKAPKIVATDTELRQIKSYAKAVAADARFANTSTVWDFWLITAELDDDVRGEVNQKGRPRGIAYEPELPDQPDTKVRVWVRTWSEIIDEAKRRLSFFRDGLDHDPSLEHALEYLIREHADVIPADIAARAVAG